MVVLNTNQFSEFRGLTRGAWNVVQKFEVSEQEKVSGSCSSFPD